MKKLIILLIIVCSFTPALRAVGSPNQHLSPKEEAAKFFPVYFELQDRKKQLNDEAWKLLRSGKDEKTTDTQYGEILEGVYDARIASDRLDKTYFEKFKKILSCKKIYLVQRAEMRFHRELLKGVRDNKGGNERPQGKRK